MDRPAVVTYHARMNADAASPDARDWNALADRIREWAGELGFARVGIADTDLSRTERDLQQWLAERDASLAGSSFYSDSHNDLPLLERVESPVAVDPDEHLAREADRRGDGRLPHAAGADADADTEGSADESEAEPQKTPPKKQDKEPAPAAKQVGKQLVL